MPKVNLNMAEKRNSLSLGRGLLYVCAAALLAFGCYNPKNVDIIAGEIVSVKGHDGTYGPGMHYGVGIREGNNVFDVAIPLSSGEANGLAKKVIDMSSPPKNIAVLAHPTGFRLFPPVWVVSENEPFQTW
jgi:hypothetical protein